METKLVLTPVYTSNVNVGAALCVLEVSCGILVLISLVCSCDLWTSGLFFPRYHSFSRLVVPLCVCDRLCFKCMYHNENRRTYVHFQQNHPPRWQRRPTCTLVAAIWQILLVSYVASGFQWNTRRVINYFHRVHHTAKPKALHTCIFMQIESRFDRYTIAPRRTYMHAPTYLHSGMFQRYF